MSSITEIKVSDHFTYMPSPNSSKEDIATCKWCKWARTKTISHDKEHLLKKCAPFAVAHGPTKQQSIRESFFKLTRTPRTLRDLQKKFAKASFVGGLPYNVFEGEEMAAAFRALDSTFVPPDRDRVASFLDEVYDDTLKEDKGHFNTSKHLNPVFDGSDDVAFNRVINLSWEIPGRTAFYWDIIDTKATAHSAHDQFLLLLLSINAAVVDTLWKTSSTQ